MGWPKGKPKPPTSDETRRRISAALTGRSHSEERKRNIGLAGKGRKLSDKTRRRMSEAKKGKPGHACSEETKQRIGRANKGRVRSDEHKARLSATNKGRKMPASFGEKISKSLMGHPAYHRRGKLPDYKGIKMRSSYEIRTAKALDALGIKWEYEPRRFWFDSFTYTPDFFLPDVGVYWEVKGWFHHHGKAKVEAFRANYPEVPLVVFTLPCIEILEHTAKSF